MKAAPLVFIISCLYCGTNEVLDIVEISQGEKSPISGIVMLPNVFSDYLKIESQKDMLLSHTKSLNTEISNLNLILILMKEQTNFMSQRITLYSDYYEKAKKNESKRKLLNFIENSAIITGCIAATIGMLKLAQRVVIQ